MMERVVIGGATLYRGDCRDVLKMMPDQSINCCVTSPPYFGLRDYRHGNQIGLESTPNEFVAELVSVFHEVRRVLRDDGTLWLNLGDSYASGGRATYGSGKKYHASRNAFRPDAGRADGVVDDRAQRNRNGVGPVDGIKPKDLIGIPWMVAFALRADGWYLRQDIIWHKPNPMPESVTDRCTKAHEYIFLLSKSQKYFYDHVAIKVPGKNPADDIRRMNKQKTENKSMPTQSVNGLRPRGSHKGSNFNTGKTAEHQQGRSSDKERVDDGMSNRRSVWTVSTKPFSGAHFATFPPDLIEPCILSGCPVGGIVLDPFNGAATTGVVSVNNDRKYIGIELNPEYIDMSEKRLEYAQQQPRLAF